VSESTSFATLASLRRILESGMPSGLIYVSLQAWFRDGHPPRTSSAIRSAERFIEEVRGDEPELATKLRSEERELEAGGRNWIRTLLERHSGELVISDNQR
jgi:hypothetical protein